MGIERFIRRDLTHFVGYNASKFPQTLGERVPVTAETIIKLDANENPYGCSSRVLPTLARSAQLNIYPDAGQTEIRDLLREYTGVTAERIVAGSGSSQLIDLTLRLFVRPGDEVITCIPSFAMYRFYTQLCGGTLVEVDRDENFAIKVPAITAAVSPKTKLIFLANPNNPTGTITPQPVIRELLETGLPVVVDEAYYEYCHQTVVPLIEQYENLMVLRTFSKWAGLAGLRIGYGIFPPKIAGYLMRIRPPYNVNATAMIAVRETLKDVAYLKQQTKAVVNERERLGSQLRQIKWLQPFPSQTNFILCAILTGKASQLQQQLQNRGILVRHFDTPRLRNYLRISVGRPQDTDTLIKVLHELEDR